ncbi:hypothetical protein [Sulfuracidifex tepidarius]|uniref:Uncharacterized protein n=1 Tax=Sulfuracidifex tepidarius TaxID=1294262 RepID=A0A510E2R2_9CREN|nr:hypothetical protein [Sulfuracidifex tepidarius]BBG24037.1 hypothetical protein IC006_1338 [Sulfuracidifex tepidarius]BBG26792.1 hypothetical protein IC007_1313 [Sulfuracidifex tepidarius]
MVTSENVKVGNGNVTYFRLYSEIMEYYLKFLKEEMISYASRTLSNDVEFLSIVLESGDYVIFEGDEKKVNMPMPRGIASVHTHPGICLFSHKDIETADSLFIKGYVVIAVMNNQCVSSFVREGVYTEEDRNVLKELRDKVKKARSLNDLTSAYNDLSFPNFLRFYSLQLF